MNRREAPRGMVLAAHLGGPPLYVADDYEELATDQGEGTLYGGPPCCQCGNEFGFRVLRYVGEAAVLRCETDPERPEHGEGCGHMQRVEWTNRQIVVGAPSRSERRLRPVLTVDAARRVGWLVYRTSDGAWGRPATRHDLWACKPASWPENVQPARRHATCDDALAEVERRLAFQAGMTREAFHQTMLNVLSPEDRAFIEEQRRR